MSYYPRIGVPLSYSLGGGETFESPRRLSKLYWNSLHKNLSERNSGGSKVCQSKNQP